MPVPPEYQTPGEVYAVVEAAFLKTAAADQFPIVVLSRF
jgi:hypothetical protein